MEQPALVEGRDYYVDPAGLYVFTAAYLKARGTCCRSGCRHCPYGFNRDAMKSESGARRPQPEHGDPGGADPEI